MSPNETPEQGKTDMKALRRNNPSAWLELTDNQTLPLVVDALLDSPPGREFNKTELGDHAGVSRESVRKHIDVLLRFGIVEEVTETEPQRYRLLDSSPSVKELFELNAALNEIGSGTKPEEMGEAGENNTSKKPELTVDFPDNDTEEIQSIDIPS